jgi:prophage regulatory protein
MRSLPAPLDIQSPDPIASRFVRLPAVRQMTGRGRSTIYRLMAAQQFPSSVQLSSRAVGWRLSDLEQWSRGRMPKDH